MAAACDYAMVAACDWCSLVMVVRDWVMAAACDWASVVVCDWAIMVVYVAARGQRDGGGGGRWSRGGGGARQLWSTTALVFNGESGVRRPWLPWMFLRERERHRDL
ncbi:hypothetical protein Dimus_034969, partial [Dionaea muscipula]